MKYLMVNWPPTGEGRSGSSGNGQFYHVRIKNFLRPGEVYFSTNKFAMLDSKNNVTFIASLFQDGTHSS